MVNEEVWCNLFEIYIVGYISKNQSTPFPFILLGKNKYCCDSLDAIVQLGCLFILCIIRKVHVLHVLFFEWWLLLLLLFEW